MEVGNLRDKKGRRGWGGGVIAGFIILFLNVHADKNFFSTEGRLSISALWGILPDLVSGNC